MTEADILQVIPNLIKCSPEVLESVIEYIRNSEEFREFIETLDNLRETLPDKEAVVEKVREMLQEIAAKEPRIVEIKGTATSGVPIVSGKIVVTPSGA